MNMGSRRGSMIGDEEIVIKPSTELFPDEYDISEKLPLVHIFCGAGKHDISEGLTFRKTLKELNYDIPQENVHYLEKDEDLLECLDKIRDTCKDASGLILLFCGASESKDYLSILCRKNGKEDHVALTEIWSKFTSYNCEHLRNKPKLFIFQIFGKSPVATDSYERNKYDAPAEADIAVIYNKQDYDFFPEFITNLQTYGNHEDIIFLASAVTGETNALIVSTLTKKFYITHSEARGQISHILRYSSEITEKLEKVTEKVKEILPKEKPSNTKKTATGATNFLKKIQSFRKKPKHDKDEKLIAKDEKTKVTAMDKSRKVPDDTKTTKDKVVAKKPPVPQPKASTSRTGNPGTSSVSNKSDSRKGSISEGRPGAIPRRRRSNSNSQSNKGSQTNLKTNK